MAGATNLAIFSQRPSIIRNLRPGLAIQTRAP
jgi:hypothetical protein